MLEAGVVTRLIFGCEEAVAEVGRKSAGLSSSVMLISADDRLTLQWSGSLSIHSPAESHDTRHVTALRLCCGRAILGMCRHPAAELFVHRRVACQVSMRPRPLAAHLPHTLPHKFVLTVC